MNKAATIADNKHHYQEIYQQLKWLSPAQARKAEKERQILLTYLATAGVTTDYHQTKLDCRSLSPGCRSCGAGTWSCLFINGICNCRCFYCPTTQHETGVPTTSSLLFPNVVDYLQYLEYFKFKGVGLSGGEPLLTFDTTLLYLTEIKKKFAQNIHVWLYTNGTKVTEPILQQLKEAGLDEIRFDLSANAYNLENVTLAAQYIPTITVEIPAIPEDYPILTATLMPMKEAGVHFLNLHQMRVTPHNYHEFVKRNYTFLHGPKLSILESELTALRVLQYSVANAIALPINYCSSIYRNRFQAYAVRKRHAECICKPYEEITLTGMIRTLWLKAHEKSLNPLIEKLISHNYDSALWLWDKTTKTLFFHASLYKAIYEWIYECIYISKDFSNGDISLGLRYHISRILSQVTYRNPFLEIQLPSGKKLIIERQPVSPEILFSDVEVMHAFWQMFLAPIPIPNPEAESLLKLIPEAEILIDCERIPQGLQAYY